MTVRVLAFARLRELLGFGERLVGVPEGTTAEALWSQLASEAPQLAPLRTSTRFARNGALADGTTALQEGDEIALLPPVGGG
ncbi:MAG: sulfur-carrier protein [Candidatus Eremiobacteraeota bacterium]|jgi:molybdopterin converting factor small subunit|nr:sulfur-carrier protein [Candidatus Eremiobacteraeota bacterium]MEA2718849.1 sulfur-carrier protein [Candidatus Eremiobacteraeota bacterium]